MGYVYSNPYADAANAFSGGANTIGDTVLKMAMLKQQGMQRQQELMMQIAQMNQTGQYNQQRLGMEREGLDLRKKESDVSMKREEAQTEETKQKGTEEKQRFEDAQKYEGYRQIASRLMPNVGRMKPPAPFQGAPFGDATEQPALDPASLQQLLQAVMQTSKTPQEGLQSSMLIQALQNGGLNPQTEQSILTGFAPQRQVSPLGNNPLGALSHIITAQNMDPNDPVLIQAKQALQTILTQSGALGTNAPPVQAQPSSNIKSIKLVQ